MGLDDLLDSDGPGPRRDHQDRARDRRRAGALATVAVVVAIGLGVGVGIGAAKWGGGAARPAAAPTATTSTAPPASPRAAATRSPTASPTPTVDVPASGTDIGYLRSAKERGGSGEEDASVELRFDRVQFLTGKAAADAAKRNGDEESDYYVVNDNPKLRTLQVRRDAVVTGDIAFNSWAGDGQNSGAKPRTLDELVEFVATDQGEQTLFDLRYDRDGFVTAVTERYVP